MTDFEEIVSDITAEEFAKNMAILFEDCVGCPLKAIGCCDYHKTCGDNIKDWLKKEAEK